MDQLTGLRHFSYFYTSKVLGLSSPSECLNLCNDNLDCSHFTFFPTLEVCVVFDGCPSKDTDICESCVSGSVEGCLKCFQPGKKRRPKLICGAINFLVGRCLGPNIGIYVSEDADECLLQCQSSSSCQWFTFNPADNVCSLTTECDWNDETCPDCVYGSRYCDPLIPEGATS